MEVTALCGIVSVCCQHLQCYALGASQSPTRRTRCPPTADMRVWSCDP